MLSLAEIFFNILLVRSETSSLCNKPIYCCDKPRKYISEENILTEVSLLRWENKRLSLTDCCRQQHAHCTNNLVNIGFIGAVYPLIPISYLPSLFCILPASICILGKNKWFYFLRNVLQMHFSVAWIFMIILILYENIMVKDEN